MANTHRRIISEGIQRFFLKILSPLINLFTKWGLSPNAFTVAGVIITALAAMAFIAGYIRFGGALVLIGGLCDTFDGSIARSTGKASRFGAFFDSVIDRYSEFVMFLGIAGHFVLIEDFLTSIVVFFALCGSVMVSYCRARAESLGFEAAVGILQRPERIVLIGFAAMIHVAALKIVIWLIAILANLTALQRIRNAYKQDSNQIEHKAENKTEHLDKNSRAVLSKDPGP